MKDKKAAKKLIKKYKERPYLYSKADVQYAKLIQNRIKLLKKYESSEFGKRDSEGRRNDGVCSESQQPQEPRESKRQWFIKLLHKARSLVGF